MTPSPRRRLSLVTALILCSVVFGGSFAPAQRRAPTSSTQTWQRAKRPRLVLLIAVDQFRYDYLERFSDLFANNGLGVLCVTALRGRNRTTITYQPTRHPGMQP